MPSGFLKAAWLLFDAGFSCLAFLLQKITDEVDGANVLVVAHWDAVSGSVARLRPWAISDHVIHTGFTVAYREQLPGATLLLPVLSGHNLQPVFELSTACACGGRKVKSLECTSS